MCEAASAKPVHSCRTLHALIVLSLGLLPVAATAQAPSDSPAFDVAVIRPSGQEVKFERNGKTTFAYGTLTMRDVTVSTCIQYAYGTVQPLITGPESLKHVHYDITAKTSPDTSEQQVRLMMRTLLRQRFNLDFHQEKKEMRVFTMIVAKSGIKMHPSAPGGEMFHENSATGVIARSITMREFVDYLSDALGAPLTDGTELPGRYDLQIDFTPYVDQEHADVRPDNVAVMKAALKGALGLELVQRTETADLTVVDHVDPPTTN
jgi:uncharacterized protein (TIGR03435 family)